MTCREGPKALRHCYTLWELVSITEMEGNRERHPYSLGDGFC